jgi:hypothetical protein
VEDQRVSTLEYKLSYFVSELLEKRFGQICLHMFARWTPLYILKVLLANEQFLDIKYHFVFSIVYIAY